MRGFNPLEVTENSRIAEDAWALSFLVPPELREEYRWQAGQHLTLSLEVEGQAERRAFSICGPFDGRGLMRSPDGSACWPDEAGPERFLRIGYRATGLVTGLLTRVGVGDRLEVRVPSGRFVPRVPTGPGRRYLAVAAGSGITPVLALLAEAVALGAEFDLLFVNRTPGSVMFGPEVAALVAGSGGRARVRHLFTRTPDSPRRLDSELLEGILAEWGAADEYFLCGPQSLVAALRGFLGALEDGRAVVHTELYAS